MRKNNQSVSNLRKSQTKTQREKSQILERKAISITGQIVWSNASHIRMKNKPLKNTKTQPKREWKITCEPKTMWKRPRAE